MQRQLYRHGFLILLVGFLFGLVAAITSSRGVLAGHTTLLMNGLLLVAAGVVWPSLRLSARGQRIACGGLLSSAWVGVALPGVLGSIMGFPLRIAAHSDTQPAPWVMIVIGVGLAYITVAILTACTLVAVGLRGRE